MASPGPFFTDDTMERLANEEARLLGSMMRGLAPARQSAISRRVYPSSLGSLDQFPAEVLIMILWYLDFQSLSRISRTSFLGKDLVEGMAAYRDMMHHAPEALTALGRTGLLSIYSAALLHQSLRSKECVSCYDFGAFLLLPSCERVCFECLDRNSALRVMRVNDAKAAFSLTAAHLKKIPIMRTIPGEYGIRFKASHRKSLRLVNVRQAKRLAIEVHGSSEALKRIAPRAPRSGDRRRIWTLRALHDAPIDPPGSDMSKIYRQRDQPEDELGGVATVRFPFLSPSGFADTGRLCRGCELTYQHFKYGELPEQVCRELSGPSRGSHDPFRAAVSRLRTKEDFRTHMQHCYGVQRLLGRERSGEQSG